MKGYSMGLNFISLAVLGIGAVYGNLWARRVREFLPAARNRERLVALAEEIACWKRRRDADCHLWAEFREPLEHCRRAGTIQLANSPRSFWGLVGETWRPPNGGSNTMLRIEKDSDGCVTTLRVSGRIQSDRIACIRSAMNGGCALKILDLSEVPLVDVVRFLITCENEGR